MLSFFLVILIHGEVQAGQSGSRNVPGKNNASSIKDCPITDNALKVFLNQIESDRKRELQNNLSPGVAGKTGNPGMQKRPVVRFLQRCIPYNGVATSFRTKNSCHSAIQN